MYIGETKVAGQASNAISGLGEATALSADALKRAVTLTESMPARLAGSIFRARSPLCLALPLKTPISGALSKHWPTGRRATG